MKNPKENPFLNCQSSMEIPTCHSMEKSCTANVDSGQNSSDSTNADDLAALDKAVMETQCEEIANPEKPEKIFKFSDDESPEITTISKNPITFPEEGSVSNAPPRALTVEKKSKSAGKVVRKAAMKTAAAKGGAKKKN